MRNQCKRFVVHMLTVILFSSQQTLLFKSSFLVLQRYNTRYSQQECCELVLEAGFPAGFHLLGGGGVEGLGGGGVA